MKNWVPKLLDVIGGGRGPKKTTARMSHKGWRPSIELLEDRCVPSTVSSIVKSFNGTAIPAGDTIWFNASFTASGLPKTAPVTIHVEEGAIDFTAGGVPYHAAVPNGVIVLTPGASSASVAFDPSDNDWDVSAPSGGTGDVFMGGVALPVANNLPGGIKNVSWSAAFWCDTAGVTVNWKWAAAVYKPGFGSDYNSLNVKPVDNKDLSAYHNGDQSGTPEAFKSFDVAGGTGGGGSNYTGNFTASKAVKPTLGDGLQDYPYPSSNPLTSVAFNESTVLRAANLDTVNGFFQLWYNDEHALALGVGQVNVKTSSGTTTTNYAVAPLTSNPGVAFNPAIGTTATTGDQAGTDVSGRPMAPSLFITDITNDPNNRSGDWQWGGTAIAPNAVFGTWKSFGRTVDYTTGNPTVTLVTTVDPAKNNWNLGPGSDAPLAGLANEGYGAEIRWNLADLQNSGVLVPGHTYRFYVMVHDGDQNKVGGDAGQASFNYVYPGVVSTATISGHARDNTGAPLAGVTITMRDASGAVIQQMMTDANGYYQFNDVPAGVGYTLSDQPVTINGTVYRTTSATAGTVDGTNPDGVGDTNTITDIGLNAGDIGVNYDFVLSPSGPGA